jgi:hypothetical protein
MKRAADRHAENTRKRSRAMGVAYVVFAAKHPSHFRVMFGSAVNRERHGELWSAATAAFTLVRDALVSGLSEREARKEPEHVIFGNWGLVHGLAFLAIDGHLGGNATRTAEELEAFAWKVISALDPVEE